MVLEQTGTLQQFYEVIPSKFRVEDHPLVSAFRSLSVEEQLSVILELANLEIQSTEANFPFFLEGDSSALLYRTFSNREDHIAFWSSFVRERQTIETEGTAQQLFKEVFGKEVHEISPKEIINVIRQRFNYFNLFRVLEPEIHAGREKRIIALQKSGITDSYSAQAFYQKKSVAQRSLYRSLSAAQPFIAEDLSFIQRRAEDDKGKANFSEMIFNWKSKEQEVRKSITLPQKEVLKGNFNIRRPNQ